MKASKTYSQKIEPQEDWSTTKVTVGGIEYDARKLMESVDTEMRQMRKMLCVDKWSPFYEKSCQAKNNYYDVDLVTGEPTALWMMGDFNWKYREKWPDTFFIKDMSAKEELLCMERLLTEECAKPNPDLWCLWDLAVLYNYGQYYKGNTLRKDTAKALALLHEIRARRDELTDTPTDKVISELLDDRLSYIGKADVRAEIYWNFLYTVDKFKAALGPSRWGEWFESIMFSELPGATMRKGVHIGKCKNGETEMTINLSFDTHYIFVFDESGKVYGDDVFSFIEFEDSPMGKLCRLLLLWLMLPAMIGKDKEKTIINIGHIESTSTEENDAEPRRM